MAVEGSAPVGVRRVGAPVVAVLVAGTLVSVCGDWVATVALVLAAAGRGSGLLVATLLVVELVPGVVLGAWIGRWVDRRLARRVWPGALVGQAVSIGAAVVVPGLWPKAGLVAVVACFGVAANAAGFRVLRELAGAGTGRLNALQGVAISVGSAAGAALGGVGVAAVGLGGVLGLDAASFAVFAAGVGVAVTGRPLPVPAPAAVAPPVRRRVEELRLLADPAVFGGAGLALVVAVCLSSSFEAVVNVFYLRDTAGISPGAYGVVLACWSVGFALAAAWLARSGRRAGRSLLAPASLAVGAAIGLTAGLTDPWVISAVYLAGGAGNGVFNVTLANVVHDGVPERQLAAAWAVLGTVTDGCLLVGYLGGAPGSGDPRVVMAAAGGACAAVAAVALLAGARRRRSPSTASGPVPPGPRRSS